MSFLSAKTADLREMTAGQTYWTQDFLDAKNAVMERADVNQDGELTTTELAAEQKKIGKALLNSGSGVSSILSYDQLDRIFSLEDAASQELRDGLELTQEGNQAAMELLAAHSLGSDISFKNRSVVDRGLDAIAGLIFKVLG